MSPKHSLTSLAVCFGFLSFGWTQEPDPCVEALRGLLNAGRPTQGSSLVDCRNRMFDLTNRSDQITPKSLFLIDDLPHAETRQFLQNNQIKIAIKSSAAHSKIEEVLNTTVDAVELVAYIPTDADMIANVYQCERSLAELGVNQMTAVAKRMEDIPSLTLAKKTPGRSNAEAVLDSINSDNGKFLILAAHNHDNAVRFLDGTSLPISQVLSKLGMRKSGGVLLSCDTFNHGGGEVFDLVSTRTLEWNEIGDAFSEVSHQMQLGTPISVRDYLFAIQEGLNKATDAENRRKVLLVAAAKGTALAVTSVALTSDTQEEKPEEKNASHVDR